MKVFPFLFLFTLFVFSAVGQKCKFDYDVKDQFSGKRTVGNQTKLNNAWQMVISSNQNAYAVSLTINFAGQRHDKINAGDTLMIAIENTKPIILVAHVDALPTTNVIDGGGDFAQIQTWYEPTYEITEEQIKLIAGSLSTAIKVYFGKTWYSVDISSKNGGKLSKSASCLLSVEF